MTSNNGQPNQVKAWVGLFLAGAGFIAGLLASGFSDRLSVQEDLSELRANQVVTMQGVERNSETLRKVQEAISMMAGQQHTITDHEQRIRKLEQAD